MTKLFILIAYIICQVGGCETTHNINKTPTVTINQPDTIFIEPTIVVLNGSGKGFIASQWRSLSTDTTVAIEDPYSLKTTAFINSVGIYKFELTLFSVTKTVKDTMTIAILAPG